MEVIEELPGPVIIITPPQERCHTARASQYHILLLSSNNGSFVAEWGAQKTGKNEF